eukprot:COSAG02_NODE_42452_length_384_cov_1.066667_1_plen_24_part_10
MFRPILVTRAEKLPPEGLGALRDR